MGKSLWEQTVAGSIPAPRLLKHWVLRVRAKGPTHDAPTVARKFVNAG